jgi:hypothetical protein
MPKLYPLNDFAMYAKIPDINATTGAIEYIETGTVSAFLATSDSPTATAAHVSLTMSPTFVDAVNQWLVFFDASILTPAVLTPLFATVTPYLILQSSTGVRAVVRLTYDLSREAEVIE